MPDLISGWLKLPLKQVYEELGNMMVPCAEQICRVLPSHISIIRRHDASKFNTI